MAKSISIPTEKIGDYLKKVQDFVSNLPTIIKNAPMDEKIAYGAIGLGIIFILTAIVLAIL
ncbi:MAG: hypothetical protein N3D84_02485 [Candidatus Woesearchaeota archaeon]|nr:hypothetical protein [Candidatus Woesearchaeota archaeon]